MGYTTTFDGGVTITPPLNAEEISYLRGFANTRRGARGGNPYALPADDGGLSFGQGSDGPDADNPSLGGQPGYWCQWVPIEDGTKLVWDEGEKFYDSEEWMKFLIDHFLKPDAVVKGLLDRGWPYATQDPRLLRFTFDHVCTGQIEAQGEESDDMWALIVTGNVVKRASATVTYDEAVEV